MSVTIKPTAEVLADIDAIMREVWGRCTLVPQVIYIPAALVKVATRLFSGGPIQKRRGIRGRKRAMYARCRGRARLVGFTWQKPTSGSTL